MKILQTSDLHLDPSFPERLQILKKICDICVDNRCDYLIICGDLFDSESYAHQIRPDLRNIFQSFKNLKIIIFSGNHDSNLYDQNLDYGNNVEVISSKGSKIKKIDLWNLIFIPYAPDKNFKDEITKINLSYENSIIFSHGTLYDERFSFIYEELEEYAKYMPIYSWDIAGKARYIGLGHFHIKFAEAEFDNTKVIYSGTPTAVSSSCVGKRKVVLLSLDKDFSFKYETLDVPGSYYWQEYEFNFLAGKEKEKINEIKTILEKEKNSHVKLNIKVSGIISIEEIDFKIILEKLQKDFENFYSDIKITNSAVSLSKVIDRPIVKDFIDRLENSNTNPEVKEKAYNLALTSFSKAIE